MITKYTLIYRAIPLICTFFNAILWLAWYRYPPEGEEEMTETGRDTVCRRAAGDWPAPLTDHCHLPGGTLRWRRWRRLVQRWRGCGWWWWTPAPSSTAARRRGCCSPSPAPSTRKEQTKLNRDPTPRLVPWLGRYRQHGANDIRFETVDTLIPNQSPFQKDTNGLATTSWNFFFFFLRKPTRNQGIPYE